jgi:hypothetical protein
MTHPSERCMVCVTHREMHVCNATDATVDRESLRLQTTSPISHQMYFVLLVLIAVCQCSHANSFQSLLSPEMLTTPYTIQSVPPLLQQSGVSGPLSPSQVKGLTSQTPLALDGNDQFNFNLAFPSSNFSYFFNFTTDLKQRFVLGAFNTSAVTAFMYSLVDGTLVGFVDDLSFNSRPGFEGYAPVIRSWVGNQNRIVCRYLSGLHHNSVLLDGDS